VDGDRFRRARADLVALGGSGLDWVRFAVAASDIIGAVVPFDGCCWHTVDPGTVLFTGSVNRAVGCSGTWLAEHEYVIDDVNTWWFLARSGRLAGATSIATHGDLSRSARHRTQEAYGFGDELRGSFVAGDGYWGAAGFLRHDDRSWFTEVDVRFLAGLSEVLAAGLRRALLTSVSSQVVPAADGPGVVVFDDAGHVESISPAAVHWIDQLVEEPPPAAPAESKMVQAVAARARALARDDDPLQLAARSRVQTRSGAWLLLYGTPLAGGSNRRTAVIIQPATPAEVAPLVALAYGLTARERQVVRLCLQGRTTKEIAGDLYLSPYTVQDHLKSIFDKTGVRSRKELVGQVFLEHYVPRWDSADHTPAGWFAAGELRGSSLRRAELRRSASSTSANPGLVERRRSHGPGSARGAARLALHVDHPLHAEAVRAHPEQRGPERGRHRHDDLAPVGEGAEHPASLVVVGERDVQTGALHPAAVAGRVVRGHQQVAVTESERGVDDHVRVRLPGRRLLPRRHVGGGHDLELTVEDCLVAGHRLSTGVGEEQVRVQRHGVLLVGAATAPMLTGRGCHRNRDRRGHIRTHSRTPGGRPLRRLPPPRMPTTEAHRWHPRASSSSPTASGSAVSALSLTTEENAR
jgi:DNA-binding CsgD family transcriptional regulator